MPALLLGGGQRVRAAAAHPPAPPQVQSVQYSAVQYSIVQYSTVHPRWRRPASLALKERSHYYEWGLANT